MEAGMQVIFNINSYPKCRKCDNGDLLPLQDMMRKENQEFFPYLKGWMCTSCDFIVVFKGGEVIHQKPQSTERKSF